MSLVVAVLRLIVRAIYCKWQECKSETPLFQVGVFIIAWYVAAAQAPVKTTPGTIPVPRTLCHACAQYAILNIGCVKTLRHPDAFFEQNAIYPTEPVGKNGKAFF